MQVALLESAPGSRSAQELRAMYSMVVIRSINGERGHGTMPWVDRPIHQPQENATGEPSGLSLALSCMRIDPMSTTGLVEGQQTKFYAEPVNVLAGRLGLPQWLVDLRHEATHSQVGAVAADSRGPCPIERCLYACVCPPHTHRRLHPSIRTRARTQLPSLSSLRMGAQQLLDWLFREYWQKQVGINNPSSSPPPKNTHNAFRFPSRRCYRCKRVVRFPLSDAAVDRR